MFALAKPGRLQEMLEAAGFVEVTVEAVEVEREYPGVDAFLEETLDLSLMFSDPYRALDEAGREKVSARMAALAAPYTAVDGSLRLPGRSLVAAANA